MRTFNERTQLLLGDKAHEVELSYTFEYGGYDVLDVTARCGDVAVCRTTREAALGMLAERLSAL